MTRLISLHHSVYCMLSYFFTCTVVIHSRIIRRDIVSHPPPSDGAHEAEDSVSALLPPPFGTVFLIISVKVTLVEDNSLGV